MEGAAVRDQEGRGRLGKHLGTLFVIEGKADSVLPHPSADRCLAQPQTTPASYREGNASSLGLGCGSLPTPLLSPKSHSPTVSPPGPGPAPGCTQVIAGLGAEDDPPLGTKPGPDRAWPGFVSEKNPAWECLSLQSFPILWSWDAMPNAHLHSWK